VKGEHVMTEGGNAGLMGHVQTNYRRLRDGGAMRAHVEPETGFFVFADVTAPGDRFLGLDQRFFELSGYPGYIRINL
jgi:hypothetical protein